MRPPGSQRFNILSFCFIKELTGGWDRLTHHWSRQTYQPINCITLAPSKLRLGHTARNPCQVPKMVTSVCTLGGLAGTGGGSCETGRCSHLYLPSCQNITLQDAWYSTVLGQPGMTEIHTNTYTKFNHNTNEHYCYHNMYTVLTGIKHFVTDLLAYINVTYCYINSHINVTKLSHYITSTLLSVTVT